MLATEARIFSVVFILQVRLSFLCCGGDFLFSFFFYLCAGDFALWRVQVRARQCAKQGWLSIQ